MEENTQVNGQVNESQPNMNDIINNLSTKISQTLDQRLQPIEQRLNQQTPEQIEAQNEQIRQQFENNPMEFVKSIQEQAKQQAMSEFQAKYEPIIKQTQQLGNRLSWQDQVRQFTSTNPEAAKVLPEITQVLQENPALMGTKDPLGTAYRLAMSNKLLANGNPIDSILGNEEYKAQLLQNPQLKEMIIQEYQQGLNTGNGQAVPPMMGNQGGTSIPASTGEQPNNLKEASQSALRRLQMLQGR
jgi:hypothetical protein